MEERVTPAVVLEAAPHLTPVVDRMHRFVLDQLLEDRSRRLPVDSAELQDVTTENRLQDVRETGFNDRPARMIAQAL